MHCEYCDTVLEDPGEARRHILTIAHFRNKTAYDLSMPKYAELKQKSEAHPKNLKELCSLLNMRSEKDVLALKENGFFKMTTEWHYKIAEELVHVLRRADNDYFIRRLPPKIIQPFVKLIEMERTGKLDSAQQGD